ncbi:hypothetical protein RhiirA5_433236 [Rhizophagus irregularis]|uniref:Uncharacterized protein n=1 Tax=Rhizophagus irregularis TaxID=588596 RepID=A0A2I1FB69_9GLOM|nr:hypothetical protein RhiirA5_433236 [Rhizophagus irregularis]PKY31639.1 hypothetical protein RhiirB3_449337 [Rhizophagus irregularis]
MSNITDIRQDYSHPSSFEEMSQSKKVRNISNKQISDKEKSLKRCKILSVDRKKCEAIHINNSSTSNAINHLLSEQDPGHLL